MIRVVAMAVTEVTDKGLMAIIAVDITTQVEDDSGRLLLHLHDPMSVVYMFSLFYTVIVAMSTFPIP